jgi:hypothetical protein
VGSVAEGRVVGGGKDLEKKRREAEVDEVDASVFESMLAIVHHHLGTYSLLWYINKPNNKGISFNLLITFFVQYLNKCLTK